MTQFPNEQPDSGFSPGEVAHLLAPHYARGERVVKIALWFHFAIALGLAFVYDTWLVTVPVAAVAVGMFAFAVAVAPGTFATRCVAGIALQTFVALHIYQMHGLPEMHFFFFTAFTLMVACYDWRAMWPGALLIIGQHIVFAILTNSGVELSYFDVRYVGVTKLFFHFGIAIGQVAICGFWAAHLRREVLRDARQRQQIAQATAAAEAANQTKSDFLAHVSHELRTPLNGLLGMAGLALSDELPPGQRQRLEVIDESARGLLGLIDDVLDLSSIEAGKLKLNPTPFDVRAEVRRAAHGLAVLAERKRLGWVVQVADGVPAGLLGDAGRLRQVLVNLLGNALKFTETGEVTLTVASLGQCRGRERLLFDVTDTGIGIPVDRQAVIFLPFEQADRSTTRRFGGTGLGLSISAKLVGLLGGQMCVDSEPSAGSTFRFTVLLPAAAPPAERPPTPAAPTTRPLRVLLAEDNRVNQLVAVETLERAGHRVTVAADGAAALDYLARATFDLVLLDNQMPLADGVQLAKELRAAEAGTGRRVPVIAVTASAMAADREKFRRAGADGFVAKPFGPADLLAAIAAVIPEAQPGPPPAAVPARRRRRVVDAFLAELPAALARLRAAERDPVALARAAHKLAGAVSFFEPELAAALQLLETDPAQAPRLEQLFADLERLAGELRADFVFVS